MAQADRARHASAQARQAAVGELVWWLVTMILAARARMIERAAPAARTNDCSASTQVGPHSPWCDDAVGSQGVVPPGAPKVAIKEQGPSPAGAVRSALY